jgi:3-oxoacyl-[acyl-carrier-protein] synthase II
MHVSTACATGTHAIGEAAHMIARGDADVMIAGGAEAGITPLLVAGFSAANALSTRNETPAEASRPFDRERDGFVMGEGAGILVLEDAEHARKRGGPILAELAGYGLTDDAYHMRAPEDDGDGGKRAMRAALDRAKVHPDEVDYVNAHGTGTPLGDKAETIALKALLGDHARSGKLWISSTKSMVGHVLGAAGALEAVVCVKTIVEGKVHPTINLRTPDPDCDLDYVANEARDREVRVALSNSFGFGGHNASLLFRAFEG